jgi:muramidase (phage lysozyme)
VNDWTLSAIVAAVGLLAIAYMRNDLLPTGGDVQLAGDASGIDLEQGQAGGVVADALAAIDPTTYVPAMTDDDQAAANVSAFLQTIRKAEGTDSDDGYRTMFGYRYFSSYADHPRSPAQFTDSSGVRKWTSAAGAYQMMAVSPLPGGGSTKVDTWDRMKAKLALPDFSPASQDAAAVALIDGAGALNDVRAGRFDQAIAKVKGIWASLPGAGYGQPERTLDALRIAFTNAGGVLA